MKLVRLVFAELLGLFVDDGSLAVLTLLLVAVVTGLVKLLGVPPFWGGALLLVGCLAILAESAFRAVKRYTRRGRPG